MRAGDGMRSVVGRRLACHAMIQPDAARDVLSDPVLRNQGFLSRFLPARRKAWRAGGCGRNRPQASNLLLEPIHRGHAENI